MRFKPTQNPDLFSGLRVYKPLLVVISGPSAVGKDAVIEAIKQRALDFTFVTTATSRKPRPYEKDGVDYFFYSRDQFEKMISEGRFAEYALVYGDYKGVPVDQIEQALCSHCDILLRVDVAGAATLRSKYPEAVLIFLVPGNEQEWLNRFKTRNTETAESLELRRKTARHELEQLNSFDYLVVNEDGKLDKTVDLILDIIRVEHYRVR
ncbi:MAG: guanylate kinase [Anaerolineaceae bacterium]|nr:guanylate kinase [Anaerolineaceae bacterium]MBN2677991.1 guanylate kinase [Anaerolineaceae bacterium]